MGPSTKRYRVRVNARVRQLQFPRLAWFQREDREASLGSTAPKDLRGSRRLCRTARGELGSVSLFKYASTLLLHVSLLRHLDSALYSPRARLLKEKKKKNYQQENNNKKTKSSNRRHPAPKLDKIILGIIFAI
ncbi:hypothetical protein ABVT39_000626 [Epinephelus coioides]